MGGQRQGIKKLQKQLKSLYNAKENLETLDLTWTNTYKYNLIVIGNIEKELSKLSEDGRD